MIRFFYIISLILAGFILSAMTIYDIKFEESKSGRIIDLADYKGQVIMIVNTASECGFAKQYKQMQEIWDKYRNQGFILIALPTNDFGGQEPGSNEEIHNFCEVNFGANFLIAKKVTSKGANINPFFKLVKEEFSIGSGPLWNFYKYIYSSDGKPLAWYSPLTKPDSIRIKKTIEKNLPQKQDEK